MIFNTINYFIFFCIVFILYYLLQNRYRWILLLSASIIFYLLGGGATIVTPIIIIISTYICGVFIDKSNNINRKKKIFSAGIVINLGLLIFYKYINFFIVSFIDGLNFIKQMAGIEQISNYPSFFKQIFVPLGISYITFQAIGYLIELKRGNHKPEKNLGLFATYLMFFPKLLSGPVERAHNFLPQLHQDHKFNYQEIVAGLKRILWGLFLKLVVADRLGLYTDSVFNNYQHHTGLTLLVASIFFTIQLFADFAGYSAIAIGCAQILGYKLMENFNNPFIAKSVTEFWRRWHISLTTWVNDYIFIPITIYYRNWNKWAVVFAGMVTFIILGFWHGASWNFIIFGFLQGFIISIELFSRKIRKRIRSKIPSWLNSVFSTSFTFSYFCLSIVFFKATTTTDAFIILNKIFTFSGTINVIQPSMMIYSLLGILFITVGGLYSVFFVGRLGLFQSKNWLIRNLSYSVVIILILLFGVFDGGQFIYFQF